MTNYIAHVREKDKVVQSVEDHLFGVAKKARLFASKIGLGEQGELIGLLHDLGKYSNLFQDYIKSATGIIDYDCDIGTDVKNLKGKIDHSSAGAQLIWERLSDISSKEKHLCAQILALCIASHHSGLIDCLSPNGENTFIKRMSKSEDLTHLSEVKEKMDELVSERFESLIDTPSLASGLYQQYQQIENVSENSMIKKFKIGLLTRFLFSALVDADRVDTIDFVIDEERPLCMTPEWQSLIDRLESHLNGFSSENYINSIRKRVSDQCQESANYKKGVYTLTVPTGGGKTLAGLRFALHHAKTYKIDRILYFIPFTSIIDQNADVVRRVIDPEGKNVILEHHSNLIPEKETPKNKLLSENWDSSVVFTTNVQFLETLFGAGTRGVRRMHSLANSVLIFDEIQSLPIKCIHMFNNAINFLVENCGCTVVLCTATQPLLDNVDESKGRIKITGEIISDDINTLFQSLKRVEVIDERRSGGWSREEISSFAVDQAKDSNCLVVLNTKKSAEEVYKHCKIKVHYPVYHLSTNMCPAHRRKVLKEIKSALENQESIICISTQLIEAGVDIDFNTVIRSLAGMDSIAQASGRCNRNGNLDIGHVYVVNEKDENLADSLKDIKRGQQSSNKILNEIKEGERNSDCLSPETLKSYFTSYFHEIKNDLMSYPVDNGHTLLDELSFNVGGYRNFLNENNNEEPKMPLYHSFMSAKKFKAIDTFTRGIIVPYDKGGKQVIRKLCSAFSPTEYADLLQDAKHYTVNVFDPEFKKLRDLNAAKEVQEGTEIYYLDNRYYNHDTGLTVEMEELMEDLFG